MTKFRFKKTPGNFGLVNHPDNERVIPSDIYEYAKSFRSVYTRSSPLLKPITNLELATYEELHQLYGKAQSLAIQIALSNELLLKAILLGSTTDPGWGHSLKELINKLDDRYVKIIKKHLEENGLKDGAWDKVLEMSALTFKTARYGFKSEGYALDFRTLQLLNEALDDIFNSFVPDWTRLTQEEQGDQERLKKEVDLLFDEEYQRKQATELREWKKVFKETDL